MAPKTSVASPSSLAYSRGMRKVPDTWWGAIIVGVSAGAVGGVTAALVQGIWSNESVAHRMFVAVPSWIAGGVVLCMHLHAHNMRRARQVG
jgi:hypothetical protein